MTRTLACLTLPLLLVACSKDTDEDGLTDKEEAELGTSADNPDSDGDGLSDGEEVNTHKTDPTQADTDGDGYPDNIELDAGTDPVDADSVIYQGGWPYQPDKDGLDGPSFEEAEAPAAGVKFPRMQVVDQYGDTVDLYDLAGHGKPIVIDISAVWCGPCNAMSEMLATGGTWVGQDWPNVKDKVDNGELYWVTVLGQDNFGKADLGKDALHEWDEKYPNENVPVVGVSAAFNDKYVLGGWPTVYYVASDMTIEVVPTDRDPWGAMDKANE